VSLETLRASLGGVWSAAPTPFDEDLRVDRASIERMVEHHLRLGVRGLFLCGSCGEGPWMTDAQRVEVVSTARDAAAGRLPVVAQATDNSAARALENAERLAGAGAEAIVLAAPFAHKNPTPANMEAYFLNVIEKSPLPVGIYDLGKNTAIDVPVEVYETVARHEKVLFIKDSSCDPARAKRHLATRDAGEGLVLLNGYEFDLPAYARLGYDGALIGGGVFNGWLAGRILEVCAKGDFDGGDRLQERMTTLMNRVFGGETRPCWLSGQKELLVQMGVFSTHASYLKFPLTEACIEEIRKVVKEDRDVLFPVQA
jgi:4-hydroxy-tetrahydrodipicolinate synthase